MISVACYAVYRGADPRLLQFYRSEALKNARIAVGFDVMFVRQTSSLRGRPIRLLLSEIRESARDLAWYLQMLWHGHLILPLPLMISILGLFVGRHAFPPPPFPTVASLYSASWPDKAAANEIIATYLRFIASPEEDYGLNAYDGRFLMLLKRWRIYRRLVDFWIKALRPKIFLALHSGYLHHQVPCDSAVRSGVPTLALGTNDCLYRVSDYRVPCAFDFPAYDPAMPPVDLSDLAAKGHEMLAQRLTGNFDPTIPYMQTSAYEGTTSEAFWALPSVGAHLVDILRGPRNPFGAPGFITVFMHEFNDWHHNDVLPPFATSYFDWLLLTISLLAEQQLPYVVKIHPCIINYPSSYASSIDALIALSRRVGLPLPVTTSLTTTQLIDAGMKLAVSVRGTIALELAYLRAPFLCAGRPPFAAFFPLRMELDYGNYCRRMLRFADEPPITADETELAAYYVAKQAQMTLLPELDLKGPRPALGDNHSYSQAKAYLRGHA